MADNSSSVNAFWKNFDSLEKNQSDNQLNVTPARRSSIDSFWEDYDNTYSGGFFGQDTLASLGSGAGNLLNMTGMIYGIIRSDFDKGAPLMERGAALKDYSEQFKTPDLRRRQADFQQYVDSGTGEWNKAGRAIYGMLSDPKLTYNFLVEQVPLTIASGGTGALAVRGAGTMLGKVAAQRIGAGTGILTGATLNAGDISKGVYDDVMSLPQAILDSSEDYQARSREIGQDAAREELAMGGARNTAIAVGALSAVTAGALPATVEKTLAGQLAGGKGKVSNFFRGAVGEGLQETLEEGGGQLIGNINLQSIDPSQNIFEGVGQSAAQGGLLGATMGGSIGLLSDAIEESQAQAKAQGGDLLDQANAGASAAASNAKLSLDVSPTERLRQRQGFGEPERLMDLDELAGTSAENPLTATDVDREEIAFTDIDAQIEEAINQTPFDAFINGQLRNLGQAIVVARREQRSAESSGNQELVSDLEEDIGRLQLAQSRIREIRELETSDLSGANEAVTGILEQVNNIFKQESGRREAYAYNEILEGEILPPLSETIEMLRAGGALPQQDRLQISSPPDLVVDAEGVATQYDRTGQRRIGRSDPDIIFGERPESVVRRKANGKAYPTEKSAQVALKNIQKAETEYNWSVIKEGNRQFALEGKLQTSERGPRTTGVTEKISEGAIEKMALDQSLSAILSEELERKDSIERFSLKEQLYIIDNDIGETQAQLKEARETETTEDEVSFTGPIMPTDSLWLTIMKKGGLDYDAALSEGVIDSGNGFFEAQPEGHKSIRWTVFKRGGKLGFDSLAEALNEDNWGAGETLSANDVVELVGDAIQANTTPYNPTVERDNSVANNERYIEELEIYLGNLEETKRQYLGTPTDPSTIFKVKDLIAAGIPQDLIGYHSSIENFDNMSGEIYATDGRREEAAGGFEEEISAVDAGTDITTEGLERTDEPGNDETSTIGVSQDDRSDQGISDQQDGTDVDLLQSYTEADLQKREARDLAALDAQDQIDREREEFGLDSPSGSATSDPLARLQDTDLLGFADVQPSGEKDYGFEEKRRRITTKMNSLSEDEIKEGLGRLGFQMKGSKQEQIERVVSANEALHTITQAGKQYDSVVQIHNAIKSGEIDPVDAARWASALKHTQSAEPNRIRTLQNASDIATIIRRLTVNGDKGSISIPYRTDAEQEAFDAEKAEGIAGVEKDIQDQKARSELEFQWQVNNIPEVRSFWQTASKATREDLLTRANALGDTPRKQKQRINKDDIADIPQEAQNAFVMWGVDNWDAYLAEYKADYNNFSPAEKARYMGMEEDALRLIKQEEARELASRNAESPSNAPEHRNANTGVSSSDLTKMAENFKRYKEEYDAQGPDQKITAIFDEPQSNEIIRLKEKVNEEVSKSGYLSEDEANKRIQTWRANAIEQGKNPATRASNNRKVVLSLFDLSGEWAKPWREAGYDVYTFDIQDDNYLGDVNNFGIEFFSQIHNMFEGNDIHAILAACPCTDFASSGARHFATKDADGRTIASVELVQSTLATIEYFKPNIWAIENPVGRIANMNGLPHWRMSLDPYHVGEDYTKQTLFWGRFNGDLPIAPREPVKGSKMHTMFGGSSIETKNARSETPEGFSYAFFHANNALDHPVMTEVNKFEMMDPAILKEAVGRKFTGGEIQEIVADAYWLELDYEKANELLKDAIQKDQQVDDDSDPALSRISPFLLRDGILTDKNFDSVIERVTGKDRVASDNIVVVDTYFELPFDLREKAQEQNAGPGGIQGAFHRGKVYLVRDQVSSEKEAEEVLLHEGTHGGFRDMYADKNVKAALNKLYAGMGGRSGFMDTIEELGITERIQVYLKDLDNAVDNSTMDVETRNAILVEEVIAFTGQQGSKTLRLRIKEVIGAIKEWLRNTGYIALSKITSSDIARMAKKARDNFFRNEQYTSDNDPSFSLENPPKIDWKDTRQDSLYSNAARIIGESGDKLFRTSKKNPMGLAGGEQIFSFLKNKITKEEARISEVREFLLGDPVGSLKAKFSKDEVIRYFRSVMPEIETKQTTGMGEDQELEWDDPADRMQYDYEGSLPDIEYEAERNDWSGDAGEVLEIMLGRLKGEGLILKVQDSDIVKNYNLDDVEGKDDLVERFEEAEINLYDALDNQFYQTEFTHAAEEWVQEFREPLVDIRHSDLDAWNGLEYKIVGNMDLNREDGYLTVMEYTNSKGWNFLKDFDSLGDAKQFVNEHIRDYHYEAYSEMYSETEHFNYVISGPFPSEQRVIDDYAETTHSMEENPYSDSSFYTDHFPDATNLLVNVITTDRPFESGGGNMKVIEEAQSDWDQRITDKGGRFRDSDRYEQAMMEQNDLRQENQKQANDYQDLIVNGDFQFKFPSFNIVRDGVSKPLKKIEKNIISYGTSGPDFNRAVTVKGKKPNGDQEKYGRDYMGKDLLEKSLRTLAHVDALREVFTDKGYNKLLRNAENYTKSRVVTYKFNPASWEFVGDGPSQVMRAFREYLERTINQDDIREEHQQTYLDAKPSKLHPSKEGQQGSGTESKVNLYSFFRRLNYSMIPETIDYLDKSLDSTKLREADYWVGIFDNYASTVLHSLANFHSAKLLIFNKPKAMNKRLTEKERGYIAPISQSLADQFETSLKLKGVSIAHDREEELSPEMPFGNDAYLKLAAKKTLIEAIDSGFEYVGHANGTRQAIKTSASRVSRRMNFQYNQKFPSIFEKLTGQKPILVDPKTNQRYTSPNPDNLFVQEDGTPVDATTRANKEQELAEIEGSIILKMQSNYAEANTNLNDNALLDKNLLVVYRITPELKEKIAYEGLPMFSRTGEETGRLHLKRSSSETISDLLTRRFQDKFLPVKRLQQSIEEQTQDKIHEDADPYLAEELFYGKTEEDLRQIDLTLVQPLMDDLKESGLSVKELDDYLMAKHAPERNRYIASINDSFPDGGSGLSTSDAEAYLAKVAKNPEKFAALERNAKRIREMVDYTRDLMVEGGMVSEMEAASWQDNYDNYVPLKGFAEDENTESGSRVPTGKGYAIGGKENIRALGRHSRAASPTVQVIADMTAKNIRFRKNEVGQSFLSLAEQYPDPNFWQIFTEENPDKKSTFNSRSNSVEMMPVRMAGNDNYFPVKREGTQYYIKIEDQRLLDALHKVGPQTQNTLTQIANAATRWLSFVNTAGSPQFLVTNFTRDIQAAAFNIQAEQTKTGGRIEGEALAKNAVANVRKAIWAIGGYELKDRIHAKPDNEYQAYYDEMLQVGGKTGFFDSPDLDKLAADINARASDATTTQKMLEVGGKVVEFVTDINTAVENGIRLSTYVEARKAGVSAKRSASLVKNLTVNFNRKGEYGQFINSFYMFFNAAVQGLAQFGATLSPIAASSSGELRLKRNQKGKVDINLAQKIAGGMIIASYGLAAINRSLGGDDDDGIAYFDKIPHSIRERNLIVMNPNYQEGSGNHQYVKVPLPYGFNFFWNLGDSLEAMVNGSERRKKDLFGGIIGSFMTAFSPLSMHAVKEDAGIVEAGLLTASPSIIVPAAEIAFNTNFFGSDIYRENFPAGAQRTDAHNYYNSTKTPYKMIAQFMNDAVGGGSEYREGDIGFMFNTTTGISTDFSPDALEHVFEYALGGIYRDASQTFDLAERITTDKKVDYTRIPFASRVVGRDNTDYADIDEYYRIRQLVLNAKKDYDEAEGKIERDSAQQKHQELHKLLPKVRKVDRKLSDLRDDRDDAQDDTDLTPSAREAKIEEIRIEMDKEVDEFYLDYQERLEKFQNNSRRGR